MKSKLLYLAVGIYIIGIIYTILFGQPILEELFSHINILMVLFIVYNLWITINFIFCFGIIKHKISILDLSIYNLGFYIVYLLVYYIWEIYKDFIIFSRYEEEFNFHEILISHLIRGDGYLVNLVILILLLNYLISLKKKIGNKEQDTNF